MANILLSFVGRNRYERCVYFNPQTNEKSSVVRFVSEAICELNCRKWTEQDRIIIFLTKDARSANWDGSFYKNDPDDTLGLEERLLKLGLKATIETHEIKEGFDETEFGTIFKPFLIVSKNVIRFIWILQMPFALSQFLQRH